MLRLLIIVLFLVVLIVFALSNPDPATLWVVSYGWQLALGVFTLGVGVASFVVGAFVMWVGELRQRTRARHAESEVRKKDVESSALQQRLIQATAPTVPPVSSHGQPLPVSGPQG